MRIVLLGWGSLIWSPNGLPIVGDWHPGGPVLPIEFSRVSQDGRLTLVIDELNGTEVCTRYALSPRTDLKDAVEDLMRRECTVPDCIGFVDLANGTTNQIYSSITKQIRDWPRRSGVDAVIWTALKSNFEERTAEQFAVERAITYLQSLRGSERENAFNYIRKAPEEVNTSLRRALDELGFIRFYR